MSEVLGKLECKDLETDKDISQAAFLTLLKKETLVALVPKQELMTKVGLR